MAIHVHVHTNIVGGTSTWLQVCVHIKTVATSMCTYQNSGYKHVYIPSSGYTCTCTYQVVGVHVHVHTK